MPVWALGLNHTTAPLDLRGRFAFAIEQIDRTLLALRRSLSPRARGRAGFHLQPHRDLLRRREQPELEHTLDWLAESGGVSAGHAALRTPTRCEDEQAARHAFRVASGLDSMVLGEAADFGPAQGRGARCRGGRRLGHHPVASCSSARLRWPRRCAPRPRSARTPSAWPPPRCVWPASCLKTWARSSVLFVGAGEMIELCATHFAAKNPKRMAIANRTLERGEKLASRFGGEVMRLADLPDRLHEFDAVISCTASTLPIIGLGAVERALKKRRHRPMFMVDLAVPRDIEPEVKALGDVYLYTVDDLAGVVQTAQANRQAAVAQAEAIVDAGVQSFMHWVDQRSAVPLIQQLNAQADEWRAAELARARKLLAKGEDVDAVLEALSARPDAKNAARRAWPSCTPVMPLARERASYGHSALLSAATSVS